MISTAYSYWKFLSPAKYNIDTFDQIQTKYKIGSDPQVKYYKEIHLKHKLFRFIIGYIRYSPDTGEINRLFIDEYYRRSGLGTELVTLAIEDMERNNVKEVWAVTIDNHPFWSKLMNFKPRHPVHESVHMSGYYMPIIDFESISKTLTDPTKMKRSKSF